MTTIMYVSAILAVVIILTIIGVLSRYRRCKPNQVLVVYGKTGGEKKSAKLYHGGAAFVLPIIQSYDVLSMEPMQIDCRLTGALSSQNIRVDVPTTITVAISTNPEIMQNAAERLLGMDTESTENLITDIVYGQMRLIIAEMTIEKLNSDRDEFLDKARKNIDNELNKLGLYLLNINISDIRDEAGYIMNLGKEAESKALNEAQANIEEQEKLGAIKIAVQQKEKETAVANTQKEQEIQIAYTEKEKETVVAPGKMSREEKSKIIRPLIKKGLKNKEIAECTGIPLGTVNGLSGPIRKELKNPVKAEMIKSGDNSDRHKCRTCQYRHGDAGGCDYCIHTGRERGCEVEVCDKAVVGERLTKK